MNTILDIEGKYKSIVKEFDKTFNPTNCFGLFLSKCSLKLDEEKIPGYIKEAIKREDLKDIKEIEVEDIKYALTVTFTYKDGSVEEFGSNTLLFKQPKENACRIIDWMLNLKYINDNE